MAEDENGEYYYWSRNWTDYRAFKSHDERREASAARSAQRRLDWPISPRKPLPPYVRSAKQAAWELEQATVANERALRMRR